MKKLSCWNCENSRSKTDPKTIQEIYNNCRMMFISANLTLFGDRLSCPNFVEVKPKGEWIFEESSGCAGRRCVKCGTWVYLNEHMICKCDKEV